MTTPEPSEPSERELWRLIRAYAACRIDCDRSQGETPLAALRRADSELGVALRAALKPSPSPVVAIRDAAERALAAYQHRFGSVAPPMGNFVGPIDDEMQALRSALNPKRPS